MFRRTWSLPIWRRVALSTSRTNWLDSVCVQVVKRQTSTVQFPWKHPRESRPFLQRPAPRMRRQIFQFGRCSLLFNCTCEQFEEIKTCQKVINGVIKEISDDPWKYCLCSFNRPQMCRFSFKTSACWKFSHLSQRIRGQEAEAQPQCNLWQENYDKSHTQEGETSRDDGKCLLSCVLRSFIGKNKPKPWIYRVKYKPI